MPSWRRATQQVPAFEGVDPSDRLNNEVSVREGGDPCTAEHCAAVTGLPCAYVDRRERHCRTAWCPRHRVVVDGNVYCRRHAGVIAALPSSGSAVHLPLPDLDNRAPSLVGWMAKQLDADIWALMLREMEAESGGQLLSDPVCLVFVGIERQRAWERAWTLALQSGERRRVAIMVEEGNDAEVAVKIGPNVVDRLTPPWIAHRMHDETVDPDQDQRERAWFNQRVLDAMERGLQRERELARQTALHLRTSPTEGFA